MVLSPLSDLISIKRRPQTTIRLQPAIDDPVGTVSDYVFTPSIKDYLNTLMENVSDGIGGGYWVNSEYGGGKTHFLATVASLLSAADQVTDHIGDPEFQQGMRLVRDKRLFPVAFSLMGEGDPLAQGAQLFRILEREIRAAAERQLGKDIVTTIPDELRDWWDGLEEGIRSVLTDRYEDCYAKSPEETYEESADEWAECIVKIAGSMRLLPDVGTSPVKRLVSIYNQIVNEDTGYTGLLLIIDEFAAWQNKHVDGTPAYSEWENLLQTLAETLPRERNLNIFTIVASQLRMPVKFEGGRFRNVDVLRTTVDNDNPSFEYAMVVAARVRNLEETRSPEIEEYYEHYRAEFGFARGLSLNQFRDIFPIQPLAFDVLRRITASLSMTRIGINSIWEILGTEDANHNPFLDPRLEGFNRLITVSDLLESETFNSQIQGSVYRDSYKAYEQAMEQLTRRAAVDQIYEAEMPLLKAIVRTLFLWHISRAGRIPMTLDEVAEAVVAEEEFLDEPQDAVRAALEAMGDLPQVKYDPGTQELSFSADLVMGRSADEVFEDFRANNQNPQILQQRWQEYLTNPNIGGGGLTAVLGTLEPGIPARIQGQYGGVGYDGELIAARDWSANLGDQLDFDTHFRIVFMLSDEAVITPDVLRNDQVLVCVPAPMSDGNLGIVTDLLALDQMYDEYLLRQDDEALRVNNFVASRRDELRTRLLRAQQECYGRGSITSRRGIALDPAIIFPVQADRNNLLVKGLFGVVFRDRPIGAFYKNRVMNMGNDVGRVFTGLWETDPAKAIRDALENFAVGLELAKEKNPRKFDPTDSRVLKDIRTMFNTAHEDGAVLMARRIYEELAQKGIPARLATLYLLCFVRFHPDVELTLRQDHAIKLLTTGTALQQNHINASVVHQVEWNNTRFADGRDFDMLIVRSGPNWADCLEWTRTINPDLQIATAQERIEEQTRELLRSLGALRERLENAEANAQVLEEQLAGEVSEGMRASLRLVDLLVESESLGAFMQTIETEAINDPGELGRALTDVTNLYQVGQSAAGITAAHSYLANVPSSRLDSDLETERESLLARFDLQPLVSSSQEWPDLRSSYEAWKVRYIIEYRKFHRDFHQDASDILERAPQMEAKLTAVANLEQVPQLAMSHRAPDLRNRLHSVQASLAPCGLDVDNTALQPIPHCTQCNVRLGDIQEADLDRIERQVDAILRDLLGNFMSPAKMAAMGRNESPWILDFTNELGASDQANMIQLLQDENNVEQLHGVVDEEGQAPDFQIMDKLGQEYPTVSRNNLDDVGMRFFEMLDQELGRLEQEGGDGDQVEIQLR